MLSSSFPDLLSPSPPTAVSSPTAVSTPCGMLFLPASTCSTTGCAALRSDGTSCSRSGIGVECSRRCCLPPSRTADDPVTGGVTRFRVSLHHHSSDWLAKGLDQMRKSFGTRVSEGDQLLSLTMNKWNLLSRLLRHLLAARRLHLLLFGAHACCPLFSIVLPVDHIYRDDLKFDL